MAISPRDSSALRRDARVDPVNAAVTSTRPARHAGTSVAAATITSVTAAVASSAAASHCIVPASSRRNEPIRSERPSTVAVTHPAMVAHAAMSRCSSRIARVNCGPVNPTALYSAIARRRAIVRAPMALAMTTAELTSTNNPNAPRNAPKNSVSTRKSPRVSGQSFDPSKPSPSCSRTCVTTAAIALGLLTSTGSIMATSPPLTASNVAPLTHTCAGSQDG